MQLSTSLSLGRHITTFSSFGEDPLRSNPQLVAQREAEFFAHYADFNNIFHTAVNGNFSLFCEGVLFLIDLSKRLEASML